MPPQTPKRQKRKSWPARHKVLTGLIAFGALVVIGAVASASNKPSTTASDTGAAGSSASAPAAESSAASSSASAPAAVSSAAANSAPSTAAAPAGPSMTTAQQQAVEAAQGYLGMGSGFSYDSLLNQLTSSAGNGFAKSDAEFAIKYLNPDWDQQAVGAANGYLGIGTGFSEQGLLKQLTSSAGNGFTEAQAEYAVNHVHPDWDAQAVDAAKGYMQIGGFSRASLIQQLTSSYGSGFTEAQAEYAASQVGL
jgi:Host cell surface-exposed lipoprotein